MREIVFYSTPTGKVPVEEFLDSLAGKQAQKVTWVLQLVEELGRVPAKFLRKLEGTNDLWEVRVAFGGAEFRLLGFMDGTQRLVLVHAFAKKTRKTPKRHLATAVHRKRDFIERKKG